MERRTRLQLKILIAKHIRRHSKELRGIHKIELEFTFKWLDGSTIVRFGNSEYIIDGEYNIEAFSELINEAFKETLCDGVLTKGCYMCKVVLFGKPVSSFDMLQRLINKYAKVSIDRDTVKKEYFTGGTVDEGKTEYLCYDDDFCKNTIEWIRSNKTPKDYLRCFSFVDTDNPPCVVSGIKLTVETVHGKVKAERRIGVW